MVKKFFFDSLNGVKQGHILSPILFSLLLQELTNEIHRRCGHRIQLVPDLFEIGILYLLVVITYLNCRKK